MNLSQAKLVFFDLQTTGASPATGNPLEAAWTMGSAEGTAAPKIHSAIIQQPDDESVPRRIQMLTGITDGDMESAVPWSDVCSEIANLSGSADQNALVIHYAQFERPFLAGAIETDLFCTHQIATRIFPNLPSRGIRGLAGYFGFPLEECKRATTHVEATFEIWKHLVHLLAERHVTTWDELRTWLEQNPKAKRTKYEYPLDRGIRLSLPDSPGIYKMLSCKGDVLYVGKATSLKDRVNSYFRGRRKKDPRKLEMLTQAWDIQVEPCETALEASLLEVQEIKRLAPPYNLAMNCENGPLLFYSRTFDSVSALPSPLHPFGPFRNQWVLDSALRMVESIRAEKWDVMIFYDQPDEALIEDGFKLFLTNSGFPREQFADARKALSVGLRLLRKLRADEAEEIDEQEPEETDTDEEEELTPERVANRFERLLLHFAKSYLLSKRLKVLCNATITFRDGGRQRTLTLGGIALCDVMSFDYVRVLHTELNRLQKQGEPVHIAAGQFTA